MSHNVISGLKGAGKGRNFRNHGLCCWGKTNSSSKRAIYRHVLAAKERSITNDVLCRQRKIGSSSKDGMYGRLWGGKGEEFHTPCSLHLERQVVLPNMPYMGGVREGV